MSNVNISLFSLSVRSLSQSPFMLLTDKFNSRKTSFNKLHASNFISNFIYSSTSQNLHLLSSRFNAFLNTPLYINGHVINNSNYYKKIAVFPYSESLVVQNTIFNTISASNCGAAIFISDDYSDLTVNFSKFENCVSTARGGAIFCNGCKVHIDFITAKKCTAMESGQFIYSMSKRYSSEFAIGDSSFFECSPKSLIGGSRCISAGAATQDMHHTNMTSCNTVEEGAAMLSSNSRDLVLRCSIFYNASGKCLFLLKGLTSRSIQEDCIIIETHIRQNDAIISLDESHANFERFSFLRNRKCCYFSGYNIIKLLNSQIDEDFREGMFTIEHRLVLTSFGIEEILPNECQTIKVKFKKLITDKPKAKKNAFKRSSALFVAAVLLLYYLFAVVNLASKTRRRIPKSLL